MPNPTWVLGEPSGEASLLPSTEVGQTSPSGAGWEAMETPGSLQREHRLKGNERAAGSFDLGLNPSVTKNLLCDTGLVA